MKRRFSAYRWASLVLAAGLVFVLAGDRGLTQAVACGIDPLEVLNLQIKPNVLIVLDSSGSMNNTLGEGTPGVAVRALGPDTKHSKMGSAKIVLRQAVNNNAGKVQFMFGEYRRTGTSWNSPGGLTNAGTQRFSYWARRETDCGVPAGSTPCPNLAVNQINAFQRISDAADTDPVNNNLLYFSENGGPNCTVAIPPGYYASGTTLATAMAAAMNSCPGKSNNYTVGYATGVFTFSRTTGTPLRTFNMLWATATNSVRAVLNAGTANTGNGTSWPTGDARINTLNRTTGNAFTETPITPTPPFPYTYYELIAGRFWNGETINVDGTGALCSVGATVTPQLTPTVYVQQVSSCGTPTPVGPVVPFEFAGGKAQTSNNAGFTGNTSSCGGFQVRTDLSTCDQNGALQAQAVTTPHLQPVMEVESTPGPTFGQLKRYAETTSGTGQMVDPDGAGPLPTLTTAYGIPPSGGTPIGLSLRDMKNVFRFYWDGSALAAPPGPAALPASGTISSHIAPRERTIVLFVTDGDDQCAGADFDGNARTAASWAQNLYQPIVGGVQTPSGQFTAGTDSASSVTTYMVVFGSGASVPRSNWIAWGGSGMQKVSVANAATGNQWPTPTAADRALCQTCVDAFIAPDAASLARVLDAIFDLGASSGEFTAQQSLTSSVVEYVDLGPVVVPPFSALNANNRYRSITPVKFLSTFTLPNFDGQLKAFVNSGGVAVQKWNAGQLLTTGIATNMSSACPNNWVPGANTGECTFDRLHNGATEANIRTLSNVGIRRRVYTTSQNGYFGVTVDNLVANPPLAPFRVPLWPPTSMSVAPTGFTQGLFDQALGLPLDTHPNPAGALSDLQRDFKACLGTPTLPSGCTGGSTLNRMQQARREAREMILAFMAGAQFSPDASANPRRVSSGGSQGQILYKAKSWALADSTRATPALVGQPLQSTPDGTPYGAEYNLFRDGTAADPGGDVVVKGFGLRNPDIGVTSPPTSLRPVMTVIYTGANDMLHAFRAGPSQEAPGGTALCANSATVECGGQELWGFVPFDRLGPYCELDATQRCKCEIDPATSLCKKDAANQDVPLLNYGTLGSRVKANPPRREPHDYMIAAGIRAVDVFVPGGSWPKTIGGVSKTLQGVWRRVLLFGRGKGGKYFTALDVTAPGPFYQKMALDTVGPVPLWNRGNPDTTLGRLGGADNNTLTPADKAAYARMGQTWSVPAIGFADRSKHITVRKPTGVDFIAWTGSGYGDRSGCPGAPCEGTTFYTLDVLTGDVIKSVEIETAATTAGMDRTGIGYDNALVADPAAFVPDRFVPGQESHPAVGKTTRVYIGDLYGRVWKFLTDDSSVAIPVADVGADQPVGTACSLIGLPPDAGVPKVPQIYLTSGNAPCATGPFKIFGLQDNGSDTGTTTSPPTLVNGVFVFPPAASLFTRTFDQGPVVNTSAPSPHPVFRGTVQPTTAFSDDVPVAKAFVFFAGTRFNAPGTAFAPVPPPYPCRSTFDTIIFALKGDTGAAAYDVNASGDDAYTIFQNSRVVGIKTTEDPTSGTGSSLQKDEGLLLPTVPTPPPPPPGQPPQTISADVRPELRAGQPMPAVKFGSSVCQ